MYFLSTRVYLRHRFNLSFFFMKFERLARVDVSETFNADQLWFTILSGLFQRCSLPENLWTALIQLWTALKTEIFRAKNQRWNSAVQLWNRTDSELNSADFLWNSSETGNFQSKKISAESELFQRWFSLKQSCFRAVQGCFPLIQRCSALVKVRHILVWNSKNTLINTTFALFSVHFLLKTLYFSLFTILQGTCDQEAWGRGGCVNSNFWLKFRRNDFFHSWYTPTEHVFRDPNTFSNLHEAFSSVSHFVLIQRWTALIQRKPALISAGFLNPFWNSADQRWNFWNLWNSAVQRWFALGLQPGRCFKLMFRKC